jgi:ribosomal-protein-alanine N-acetyltransferase
MTPTLSTARLILRPLVKPSQRQVDWLRDPDVVRFSEQRHHTHTLASCLRYIQSLAGGHIWGLWTTADRHIGNIAAAVDAPNNIADLSILIGETGQWGQGYGTEAWREAARWLLDKDGGALRKLEAGCMAVNAPMRRLLDRTGFQFEGERKNHFLWQAGQPVGAVYYGRFR